ncbi:glycogen debranching enzyme [Sporanaerobium hydrogeniformans]|uniref:Glycogen debranching enzyme n=1 Tax=Sporanaerobium hydrogeniformans TaxID=3072179 RepID=A0AC61DE72_9FIRM|nr:alpha-amylase family glycosyl hydrolase [Sporanaerobium hydrogeniformans]PHV71461.1 glycogen debranching enzyme [Sporanaerobium hydrogeniformans]
MYTIRRGIPVLGCHWENQGAAFGIFSDYAEAMLLTIYNNKEEIKPLCQVKCDRLQYATGDIFHIYIEDIKVGMCYTWQLIDEKGEVSECLIDPYSYCVGERPKGDYLNVIKKMKLPKLKRPCIPWEKTVIYELHVGHFTKSETSGVVEEERGTFKGLCKKLDYLRELGITTIELLPIFKWNRHTLKNRHPETGVLLQDEWGYNSLSFFALDESYSTHKDCEEVLDEFHELIEKAHEMGMEIILDVVYNHTGEGGEASGYSSFKKLSSATYYKLTEDGHYLNCAGTGNTLNTNHQVVKNLILESLRYWVVYQGVDGFRFDLASILGQDVEGKWMVRSLLNDINEDPILSHVKLISESWDAKGSYDVGRMPYHFREWSDYFRDTIRKCVRGDQGLTKSLADCLGGKEVYFSDTYKGSNHAIHFITAHDGFTMWDLVSYEQKHNLENGEENRDGNNANYSTNCGFEGETQEQSILNKRKRLIKNYMALLLLAEGIPMLLMGDEMGRTQGGNNNAFCQNSSLVWVDWKRAAHFKDLEYFIKKLIILRKKLLFIKKEGQYTVSWHGVKYNRPDWSYYSRTIAYHLTHEKEAFYLVINNYSDALLFDLPPTASKWICMMDTNLSMSEDLNFTGSEVYENRYLAECYSICLFKESKV